ncbi:hypothetical protein CONPUDRAFT_69132 [Coniophora puteana RWD-64-598 SS2]|uniref:Uncharacterized protein n=1 Tax=Coniophora puteana (strain RWD-64-598) TaxID=741705 RepID=A0A5M3N5K9_CONPW|nr:uncharacterized protein CONPUDRAFT_69132 [Coniophora puteana RWD-64-598 SS2]EIW86689.1 hypothetical protein CONPUDRAFT_69132 [Coniophora puteana RWD-64-598 SS2]
MTNRKRTLENPASDDAKRPKLDESSVVNQADEIAAPPGTKHQTDASLATDAGSIQLSSQASQHTNNATMSATDPTSAPLVPTNATTITTVATEARLAVTLSIPTTVPMTSQATDLGAYSITPQSTTSPSSSSPVSPPRLPQIHRPPQINHASGISGTSGRCATIGSLLGSVTITAVDEDYIKDLPDDVQQRVKNLMAFENPSQNTFAWGKLPRNAAWGSITSSIANTDKLICNPHTTTPINVICCGKVISLSFGSQEQPVPKASIVILPPSQPLSIQACRLTSGLSDPTLTMPDPLTWHTVQFSRFQQCKLPNGEKGPIVLFDSVYDAQLGILPRTVRPKLTPLDIKKHNIVMIEARISKYNTKSLDTGRWLSRAQYEFTAIHLLYSSPIIETGDEEVGDDDVFANLTSF